MDTDLLKTFLEVQQTRHFGKAAENLYLTQAAVSARIKQLETSIGSPLFTRLRNNLQLTDTGKRLLPHAQAILIAWERARQDVSLKHPQQTVLSIGATNGLWDLYLQAQLARIFKQVDHAVFNAEALSPELLIRRLMERTLDLAMMYEPAKINNLASIEITQVELTLVSTVPHETEDSLYQAGYIAVDWGTSFNISHAQTFQDLPLPILHTNQAKIALDFMLSKGGSAYLPQEMIQPYLNTELFIFKSAPVVHRPVYACYHKENRNEDLILEIARMLERALD